jgi:hypothetical protein
MVCITAAHAAPTAYILGGTMPIEHTEANAAANLIGYHPVKNGKEQWPDPKGAPIYVHGTLKVTIVEIIRPAAWWSKYHYMIEGAAAEGRMEPKSPSSDLDSLVEVEDQHGVKVWLQSSQVWLDGAAHPHP